MSRSLAVAAVLVLAVPAALAQDRVEAGHWEVLGEDGVIWVPDEPVAGAYLPPQDLGAFHNHSEMSAALQTLASEYPSLVTLDSLGVSVEGRHVWAVTLRAGADAGRPAVLFDGAHHGDEVIASEILVRYAQQLASEYPSTERSRQILEGTTVVIVPMVNPDGIARAWNSSNYADARKNARGVDLNRNYATNWGGAGSSSSPAAATYRGPAPASEPETQIMSEILASRNWTFYSSLHSGAEMILWPYGHTTASPPELVAYTRLGNELTNATGAPNGQVSKILYSVSGDSMDQAYVSAGPYWKPLATSPETYEGSGNAADWWYLFNPSDAGIPGVVARWTTFLDHLAREAPHYAPARFVPPVGFSGPGAPFDVSATIETPLKRPFLSGSANLSVPGFLNVSTQNPIALGALNGTRELEWTVAPRSGGGGTGTLRISAGPAGNLTAHFPILVAAPALELGLAPTTVGSGQTFDATLRVTTNAALTGSATLLWQGAPVDTRAIEVPAGGALTWTVPIGAGDALPGPHAVVALVDFVTTEATGSISESKSVFVDRPYLTPSRVAANETSVGEAFPMTVALRNTGTRAAVNVTLRETLPAGYTPWLRTSGTIDPITRPPPTRILATEAGEIVLEWDIASIFAGGNFRVESNLRGILPGVAELVSDYTYGAQYATSSYGYASELRTPHAVVSGV